MKKAGILGGTFDPIHNGHIAIAECACKQLGLDFILFMPNKYPVYKRATTVSDSDRINMIKLSIEGRQEFIFSDFEISRDEPSFTSVTLPRLRNIHPDWELYYIVGSDSLCSMDKWKNPQIIFDNAIIVSAYRETESLENIHEAVSFLKKKYNARIQLILNESYPFSSTEIRAAVKKHETINGMVPERVEKYIIEKGLYHGF